MRNSLLFLPILLLISSTGSGQGDTFTPNGKPILLVYSNYHATFSQGETADAFELKRVYLGYEHNFSEHFYARANIDVGNPGVGKHEMAAYVKYAYLQYKADRLSVNFGMIATTQFKVQEKEWGYRYIEKSFQDAYGFNASADLGISAAYKIAPFLSADVIIANGEGYKKIQSDSTLRTGFGLTITPLKNLTGRVYYDLSRKEFTQSSIATYLGYNSGRFSVGGEYVKQLNTGFVDGRALDGLSFYGTFVPAPKWKIFARYDKLYSNVLAGGVTDWNLASDGQLYMAGFEFSPVKGVRLAPNFRGWRPADDAEGFITSVYLNCELKF